MEHVHTFDASEPLVSMVEFRGRVFVATTKDVYEIVDDKLIPLRLERIPPAGDQPK